MPSPALKYSWRHVLFVGWATSAAAVAWLLQTFFGTVWGVLAVSLCLYWLAPAVFGIQPMRPSELIDWFNGLTENAQVAVGAAMLTGVGLVAAYWTAMAVWKKQKFIEIRMATAADLRTRFNAVQAIAIDLSTYLSMLIESVEKARLAKSLTDARRALLYVNAEAEKFQDRTRALHEARMHVNGLMSDHGIVIAGLWKGWDSVASYTAIVDKAWEACSFIPPSADYAASNFIETFMSRYDDEQVLRAEQACERVTTSANAVAGKICANLISGAVPVTLGVIRSLVLQRSWMLAGAAYASDATRSIEPVSNGESDSVRPDAKPSN